VHGGHSKLILAELTLYPVDGIQALRRWQFNT